MDPLSWGVVGFVFSLLLSAINNPATAALPERPPLPAPVTHRVVVSVIETPEKMLPAPKLHPVVVEKIK